MTSFRLAAAGALLYLMGTACAPGERGIDVRLVDAPSKLAHLYVDVVGMAAQGPTNGWVQQPVDLEDLDVLSLRGGVDAALGRMALPAGEYNQLRLELGAGGRAVFKDGTEAALDVPSLQIQIKGHWEVRDGYWTRLTIDFLPDASVEETSRGLQLKPVLRLKSVELVPGGGPDPRDNSYTAVVGPEGGDVVLNDGSGVEVPAGALDAEQTITVQRLGPDLAQAPTSTGKPLLGGLTLLPDGLAFAVPITINVPNTGAQVVPGVEVTPVVYDPATGRWVQDVPFSDGTTAALALPDGLIAVPASHLSSHGATEAQVGIYAGTTISQAPPPALPLKELGSPGGVMLWGIQSMNTDRILDGPAGALVANMRSYEGRKDRYKDALEDLVYRAGTESDDVHQVTHATLSYAEKVGEVAGVAGDGTTLLHTSAFGQKFARGIEGALKGNLTTYRFTNLRYVTEHLQRLGNALGTASTAATVSVGVLKTVSSALVATGLEKERADRLNDVFQASVLINDSAFRDAWTEVRRGVNQRAEGQFTWLGDNVISWEGEVALSDALLLLFLARVTPGAAAYLLEQQLISSALWANALTIFAAYVIHAFVTDVTNAYRLECVGVAALTIWKHAFNRPALPDPVVEAERLVSGAYMGFRSADLIYQFYFEVDASFLSKAALWLVEELSDTVHARREALANTLAAVRDLHKRAYDNLMNDWTDPIVEAPHRGFFALVDQTAPDFSLWGPTNFWHVAPYGFGGSMLWTQNNGAGSGVGPENGGEWCFTVPVDGTYRIRVHVPDNFATALACYRVRGGGDVTYYSIPQERYFNQWVTIGWKWLPAQERACVRLEDVTLDPHLSAKLGFDAVSFEEAFDAPSSLPANTLGCGLNPTQPPVCVADGVRHPIQLATWTQPRDGDGWYVIQDFSESAWKGMAHLGEDWNSEVCPGCDQNQPLVAPGNGEVIYAGYAGTGWNGVVMIRLVASGEAFRMPDGRTASSVVVLLGHLDPASITVQRGDQVHLGDPLGVIGPAPCAKAGCGPHLHLEVIWPDTKWSNWPGPGYVPVGGSRLGRVDPSIFFALNSSP
jgi:hypothetical protein